MPLDGPGEQPGLLTQFLGIVLAKVALGGGSLVQSENIVCRLQLGHGDEADLLRLLVQVVFALGDVVYTDVAAIGGAGDALLDGAQLGDEGLGS